MLVLSSSLLWYAYEYVLQYYVVSNELTCVQPSYYTVLTLQLKSKRPLELCTCSHHLLRDYGTMNVVYNLLINFGPSCMHFKALGLEASGKVPSGAWA